jgi:hypothetical protein
MKDTHTVKGIAFPNLRKDWSHLTNQQLIAWWRQVDKIKTSGLGLEQSMHGKKIALDGSTAG